MNAYRLALGFLLLCGTGCAAPFNTFERALTDSGIARFEIAPPAVESEGRSVGIQAELGGPAGRGAIVGPTHVLTVDHVVGSHKEVWIATSRRRGRNRGWVRAHVRARYRAQPENIVLLELEVDDGFFGSLLGFTGFSPEDAFSERRGHVAAQVLTRRGRLDWRPGILKPGDSGSPVLDTLGHLVGLVVGRRGQKGVYAELPGTPHLLASR